MKLPENAFCGNYFQKPVILTALALAAAALVQFGGVAHANVVVGATSPFSPITNLYTYNYSFTNTGTFDLAIISLDVGSASNLQSLTAPTGFTISFDPGNVQTGGSVFFLEDNDQTTPQSFAPSSTVSGFSFTSVGSPSTATYTALDARGNDFTGNSVSPVPEPSSVAMIISGLGLAALIVRNRSTSRSTPA